MNEYYKDIVAENFLQIDKRGGLCIFIEKDDTSLLDTLLGLRAEGFLMCKYPTMKNESCLACKLKDGNDELIPYIGAEEFIEETHYMWYYDRSPPAEEGKDWVFLDSVATRSHDWGAAETVTVPGPEWDPTLRGKDYTIPKAVPDTHEESQLDTGVAKLGGAERLQFQFRLKHLDPETAEAEEASIADPSYRFDLDDEGNPREYVFRAGIAQYGRASARDPTYTGTMQNPFWQRARIGAIWPGGAFWEDYYDDHKTEAPDWYLCAWFDYISYGEAAEVYIYTIKCWRYMDNRLGTWRYVCIDVEPELECHPGNFHSKTAQLKFNKLQLNSVAPAEDLDLHPLEYLKEQEA